MVAFLLDSDEIRSVLCAATLAFLLDSDDLSLFARVAVALLLELSFWVFISVKFISLASPEFYYAATLADRVALLLQ
jgi:hypothetical protein